MFGRAKRVYQLVEKGEYERLLDVGCYDAKETVAFSPFCEKVYGIDPEKAAIRKAKKNYPDLDLKVGFAEDLPYDSDFFDCVVFSDVLEHVQDEAKSIAEIMRVLKPGGKLILTTPHRGLFFWLDPLNYGYFWRRLRGKKKEEIKPFHRHYTKKQIINLFESKPKIIYLKRTGFLLCPAVYNLELVFKRLPLQRFTLPIINLLKRTVVEREYRAQFGPLAYYISLVIEKI